MGFYVLRDVGGSYLVDRKPSGPRPDGHFSAHPDTVFSLRMKEDDYPDLKPGECRELVLKPVELPPVVVQVGHSYEMEDGGIVDITGPSPNRECPFRGTVRGTGEMIYISRDGKRRVAGQGPYIVRDLGPTNPPKPEPPKPDTVPPVVGHRFRCRGGAEAVCDRQDNSRWFWGTTNDRSDNTGSWGPVGNWHPTRRPTKYDLIEDLGLYVRAGYTYETREGKEVDITSNSDESTHPFWGSDNSGRTSTGRIFWSDGKVSDAPEDLVKELRPTPKPEPQYRDYETLEEAIETGTVVKCVDGGIEITGTVTDVWLSREAGLCIQLYDGRQYTSKVFCSKFTHLDKSPCGVKCEGKV